MWLVLFQNNSKYIILKLHTYIPDRVKMNCATTWLASFRGACTKGRNLVSCVCFDITALIDFRMTGSTSV